MNHTAPSTRKFMKLALSAIQKNKAQEAMGFLQQVIALNPNHGEALHQIAFLLHGSGHYQSAADFYQRAIAADPAHIPSYLLLAKVMEAQNLGKQALELVQHATQLAPENAETHAAFASLLLRFNYAHEVPRYLEQILPRFAQNMELHGFYCISLKINGEREKADACYKELLSKFRVPSSFRIMYECYMPRLNTSVEEIDAIRADFQASLERFIAEKKTIDIGQLSNNPLFVLAFHNRDNKELTKLYTKMLRVVAPELNYVAPHCKAAAVPAENQKIRVGFISRHMHNHSVGNCYRGAMLHLAKQPDMDVTFCNLSNVMDAKMQLILDSGMRVISMPQNIKLAHQTVAEQKFDLIIYPDIGMDTNTHYMAMARLAKYQACFQGHPETTGIDTVDYVISSRSYEPIHADENYTERLLCNEAIDTVFSRPKAPERWLSREEMGLPADKKLYVCPMAIQKFHPDFDKLLADILARDPDAMLVLFNDFQQQAASDLLQKRVLSHCDASRVIFLPWQPLDTLFSILKTADAILDTIYFGGGTTAQYAFGFGLPIVTMPGHYARGRVVHSYYHVMGIEGAPEAADKAEYVELAVKLAHDAEYRAGLVAQILAKNTLMWDGEPYAPRLVQLVKDIIAQDLDKYRRTAQR